MTGMAIIYNPPSRRAFTLIELLVVVAIIALLLALLSPVLGRAKELTRRTVCATQLHNVGRAQGTYASENRNLLPSMKGAAGNWLWDVNKDVVRGYLACGLVKQNLYCPANRNCCTTISGSAASSPAILVSGYCWIVRQPAAPEATGGLAGGPPLLNNYAWVTHNNSRSSGPGGLRPGRPGHVV